VQKLTVPGATICVGVGPLCVGVPPPSETRSIPKSDDPVVHASVFPAIWTNPGDVVDSKSRGAGSQAPFEQAAPGLQACPHAPQFAPSLSVSVSQPVVVVQLAKGGAQA
jgi:hypothetical protein